MEELYTSLAPPEPRAQLTQEVRAYAEKEALEGDEVYAQGMRRMSEAFVAKGATLNVPLR